MPAALIAQEVACDIALLERTRRLPPPTSSDAENEILETQSVLYHGSLGYQALERRRVLLERKGPPRTRKNNVKAPQVKTVESKPIESASILQVLKPANPPKAHYSTEVGKLPLLSSIPFPLTAAKAEISLVYVTTESGEAGAAILAAIHTLFPHINVVSTVNDLAKIVFTHTGSKKTKTKANRLKPVSCSLQLDMGNHSCQTPLIFVPPLVGT
jgi:hypothetical protein